MGEDDINPIENGVQQVYQEIRESIELLLNDDNVLQTTHNILIKLDDAISNNWDDLMMSFWRGVKQDIELLETQ